MKPSEEIESCTEIVIRLLEENKMYRDNFRKLCSKIWSIQLGGIEKLKSISTYDFFLIYIEGKQLYSHESIGRAARKAQAERKELRGEFYKHRAEIDRVLDVVFKISQ